MFYTVFFSPSIFILGGRVQTSSIPTNRNLPPPPSMPTAPLALLPSIDARHALGSPSGHRCSPCPWLSLRESWREAPERAHCTNSTHKLPTDPPYRSLIQNCIPPRTVCTSLSPSLREVPLPEGEARACVQTSSNSINRNLPHYPSMPTAPLKATSHGAMKGDTMFLSALDIISQSCRGGKSLGKSS